MLGNKSQSIHYTCSTVTTVHVLLLCIHCAYTVHGFKVQKYIVLMHLVVDS